MRKKTEHLVVSFDTTESALRMEKCCHKDGIPGRLIPLPGSISAGCGLSWSTDPKEKERIRTILTEYEIPFRGIHTAMLM